MNETKTILHPTKRCICGNQLEYLLDFYLYCHHCDIDDENIKEYCPNCQCDYCKQMKKTDIKRGEEK